MDPARRVTESDYDSDTFVSTCTTPEFASTENAGAKSKPEGSGKANGQGRGEGGGKAFQVGPSPASVVAAMPEQLGGDCG
jgi:hypothetical protein